MNWITPELVNKMTCEFISDNNNIKCINCIGYNHDKLCTWCDEKQYFELDLNTFDFKSFFAAEINKKIKNILESAEKRDCKDCAWWHELNQWCSEGECEKYTKPSHPNWTPKEGK